MESAASGMDSPSSHADSKRAPLGLLLRPSWDPAAAMLGEQGFQTPRLLDDAAETLTEWELLTDAGSTVSQCGTPRSLSDTIMGLDAMLAAGKFAKSGNASVSHELFAVDQAETDLSGTVGDEAAMVTHPNSEVTSIKSLGSGAPDSPNSVDIVIEGAEVHQFGPEIGSWMDLNSASQDSMARISEVAAAVSEQVLGGMSSNLLNEFSSVEKCLVMSPQDYVFGALGSTVHRIFGWAARRFDDVQSVLHQLGSVASIRATAYPQLLYSCTTMEYCSEKQPPPQPPRMNRLVIALGCSNLVFGISLAAAVINSRYLSMRLKQKDNELSTLLMKVLSLQESLHGGGSRRFPVICHAMAPMKHQAYM